MKKTMQVDERNLAFEEHPEDRQSRKDGEAYAKANAREFCEKNRERLERLVSTYADSRAESLLDELREEFWTGEWNEKS